MPYYFSRHVALVQPGTILHLPLNTGKRPRTEEPALQRKPQPPKLLVCREQSIHSILSQQIDFIGHESLPQTASNKVHIGSYPAFLCFTFFNFPKKHYLYTRLTATNHRTEDMIATRSILHVPLRGILHLGG